MTYTPPLPGTPEFDSGRIRPPTEAKTRGARIVETAQVLAAYEYRMGRNPIEWEDMSASQRGAYENAAEKAMVSAGVLDPPPTVAEMLAAATEEQNSG